MPAMCKCHDARQISRKKNPTYTNARKRKTEKKMMGWVDGGNIQPTRITRLLFPDDINPSLLTLDS
jgi:hypothetical protein